MPKSQPKHQVNVDLAKVFELDNGGKKHFLTVLGWGDEVEVLNAEEVEKGKATRIEVKATKFIEQPNTAPKPQNVTGFIIPPKGVKAKDVILVTHGDADHFAGLVKIHDSETVGNDNDWRRLVISPQRVYHNGLVKRPSKDENGDPIPDEKLLGATKMVGQSAKKFRVITGLEDDLLKPGLDKQMNQPFREWREALSEYTERRKDGKIEFRRLEKGMDDAFDFVTSTEPDVGFEVLGPLPTTVGGVTGLKFLGNPPRGARLGKEALDIEENGFQGMSASHTINGHSIIFRLTYGGFRFLFTGDLNDESGRSLARAHRAGDLNLEAEVFKVPHHGSADFSGGFLQCVAPVVSVVSSGDETARKEFIHPRATIMGALGKFSRVEEPLIFVTELVAFFEMVGATNVECHKLDKAGLAIIKDGAAIEIKKNKRSFFAFKRSNFGLVKIRTNGKRMLVYTNSGQTKLKEAYAYEMKDGKPEPARVRQV